MVPHHQHIRISRRTLLRGCAGAAGVLAGPSLVGPGLVAPSFAEAQSSGMREQRWTSGGLAGTLAVPAGSMRGPAAVIIAGSGPTPRDGTIGTYRRIAEGLAAAGIRSLRYDKRGVGESRGLVTREEDLLLQHFVDDAVTAARDLQARSDVSAVVLIGHSEGALLATLAAAHFPVAGIVLLAGPGRRFDVILREQLLGLPLPPGQEHVRTEAFEILAKLAKGERVARVSKPNLLLVRPSVQPYLISLIAVDPAAELARAKVPAFIIQGASDIQVRRADYDALTRARPDASALLLPDTNHVFTRAPADVNDRLAQLKSYDPKAPLVPELMPALTRWIAAVTAATAPRP